MSYTEPVEGGKTIRLAKVDPSEHGGIAKDEALRKADELGVEMGQLHDLLFEAGTHGLLIVLQGRDTSGKDGMIRHLLKYVNAQSCRVVPFKVPTAEELAHDFLWRVHMHTPAHGSIALFNRSHYEDVLVARVHKLVDESVWKRRYDHINAFEANLADAGTIIVKFYLHISKDEQEKRLLQREKETEKAWKLSVGDWQEREYWDDYTAAYEDALGRCSTKRAPWFIVPANHKWYRDLAVTERLVETLRPYRAEWLERLEKVGQTARKELDAYRKANKTKVRRASS
jgi:PPK2 family polyphosphate:nucleotide phosphotransferase